MIVIAPRHVVRMHRANDGSPMLACRRDHPQSPWGGHIKVPTFVDLDAVNRVFTWCAGHVKKDGPVLESGIRLHFVPIDDLFLLVPVSHVEILLIRREGYAVRSGHIFAYYLKPTLVPGEHTVKRQLAARVTVELRQA